MSDEPRLNGLTARDIIVLEYKGSTNMVTNHPYGYYLLPNGAAELSYGDMYPLHPRETLFWGVTVVRLNQDDGMAGLTGKRTWRDTEASQLFTTKEDAIEYIRSLQQAK